jgi:OmpA-OmpF porin, OOP family
MKILKLTLSSLLTSVVLFSFAQSPKDYNRWSIEANAGTTNLNGRMVKPHNQLFATNTLAPFHVDLGTRFMFNQKVGLKADVSYDQIANKTNYFSRDFKVHYLTSTIQGVVNLGQLVDFTKLTKYRLGVLVHGGLGIGNVWIDTDLTTDSYASRIKNDILAIGTYGMTAQLRLTKSLVLTASANHVLIGKQQTQLDGSEGNQGRIDASMFNLKGGLTVYFGKKSTHLDWAEINYGGIDSVDYLMLENRVAQLELFVANLDQSKASKDDVNKLRKEVQESKMEEHEQIDQMLQTLDLLNKQLFTIYFDFNKNIPTESSSNSVNVLVSYMKNNPTAKVILTGYTDGIGSVEFNDRLSMERANSVKKILMDAGIAENRITTVGGGIDKSLDYSLPESRRLARKVVYQITK